MLFNSFPFLFAFLPVVLIGFHLLGRLGRIAAIGWVTAASLVFYAYWNKAFLLLLLASIVFNFLCAQAIVRAANRASWQRGILWTGIAGNVGLLCYYKYWFPLLNSLGSLSYPEHYFGSVVLPLGISFFTLTQIGYLVDLQQGEANFLGLLDHLFFVSFFPHLIAGPILHHREFMPQVTKSRVFRLEWEDVAAGSTWFVMGLFKKVVIADQVAASADLLFASPAGQPLFKVWCGVLSYSIQLYFDFSGYSDMAIGLARMFGIRFPLNFNSPYKAASIQEYWRRWHMTLTRYLMEYLFDPMALSLMRRFATRRRRHGGRMTAADRRIGIVYVPAIATMLTMTIAGVWHGAGFQFVIFGVLHGVYLSICHVWRTYRLGPQTPTKLTHIGNCLLTYLCVLVGAVFFRAASVPEACRVLAGMIGTHGIEPILVPQFMVSLFSPITGILSGHGLIAAADAMTSGPIYLRLFRLVLIYVVIWLLPNTQQIMGLYRPALGWRSTLGETRLRFHMTPRWGFAIGVVASLSVLLAQRTEFIYFQF